MKNREEFIRTVCSFSQKKRLWTEHDRILLAVSGGPDSLGLLLFFSVIAKRGGPLVGCACVQHHLRREAETEARFVGAVCQELGVPFFRRDVYVKSERDVHGGSVETMARKLRYEALRDVANREKYTAVATAHHADDQAETVLYHLLRGSGTTGAAGIQPKRDDLLRPFLAVKKEDIRRFVATFPYIPCHDATNDELQAIRNKIRWEILPILKGYGFDPVASLCRMAEVMQEEDRYLRELAKGFVNRNGTREEGGILLPRDAYVACAPALRRRILRCIDEQIVGVGGKRIFSFDGIERMDELICALGSGKKTSAGGVLAEIRKKSLLFREGDTHYGFRKSSDMK